MCGCSLTQVHVHETGVGRATLEYIRDTSTWILQERIAYVGILEDRITMEITYYFIDNEYYFSRI